MADAHIAGTFEHATNMIGRPEALAIFGKDKGGMVENQENQDLQANENLRSHTEGSGKSATRQPQTGQGDEKAAGAGAGAGLDFGPESLPRGQRTGIFSKALMCFNPNVTIHNDGGTRNDYRMPSTGGNMGNKATSGDALTTKVERKVFEWDGTTEFTIAACIDFLEANGGDLEPRLFAVSADQDEVDAFTVRQGERIPLQTDLHVAAAVIKDRMRHANGAFLPIAVLQAWAKAEQDKEQGAGAAADTSLASSIPVIQQMTGIPDQRSSGYRALSATLEIVRVEVSEKRAYLVARLFSLLARIAGRFCITQMTSQNLALCLAPSLLQWDPNGNLALVVLNKMMTFVQRAIEDAMTMEPDMGTDPSRE
ncbi:hypothetical protein FVE85_7146 [Porphyridium purpureum]|uniref:Rho-GAP domain-containing protein n=1 Tax=Porphyridium purpureum TaxID=35688 RepID=A0A5J4Z6Q5_PORPP|nr:hypothetical protein FVE85_7146 [Porphyridium purpureum]|eukprot:POR4609..scf295_1